MKDREKDENKMEQGNVKDRVIDEELKYVVHRVDKEKNKSGTGRKFRRNKKESEWAKQDVLKNKYKLVTEKIILIMSIHSKKARFNGK